MHKSDAYDVREQAYASLRLSGFKITDEFKDVYEDFANNNISQLEAFIMLGINIEQIPVKQLEKLASSYMFDTNTS